MRTIKIITVTAIIAALFIIAAMASVAARSKGEDQFDAAGLYKTKCQACHGATAEKKFDTAKPDAEHVQTILKGKKAEKPPNMPGFEDKGVTEDQAKALLAHMKSLRQ
jgi:mono/diheme cytochrome c family protein